MSALQLAAQEDFDFLKKNTGQAAQWAPQVQGVQPNQLTSHNLNQLLDSENPYLKRARTKGLEHANSRGLLNSSMAAGAAETAAIEAAAPIAQADADVQFRQSLANQQYTNQAGQFNAQSQNARDELGVRAGMDAFTNRGQSALRQAEMSHEYGLRGNELQLGSELKRGDLRLEKSLEASSELGKQQAGMWAQYMSAAGDINSSDMKIGDKRAQIEALKKQLAEGTGFVSDTFQAHFGQINAMGDVVEMGDATPYVATLQASVNNALQRVDAVAEDLSGQMAAVKKSTTQIDPRPLFKSGKYAGQTDTSYQPYLKPDGNIGWYVPPQQNYMNG